MPAVVFVVPGDLETRTGGYGYDRRIVSGLRAKGWSVAVASLDPSFPRPTTKAREEAARTLAGLPDGALVMVDGLAFGVLAGEAERERERLRFVALVHHPLALETGLEPSEAVAMEASERRALAAARLVVVTSQATAHAMGAYGVGPGRLVVVEPGTDPAPLARGGGRPLTLLTVATVVPRKGHDTLVAALASLTDRPWRLVCAGSLDRDLRAAASLRAAIRGHGIEGRVTLAGDLDEAALAREYDRADLFVLPTYFEGYGMAVAEALARGLPVVSTATGGIPDLVADEAGLLVQPGDVPGLAAALASVMDDQALRLRLGAGARRARQRLPTWRAATDRLAAALARIDLQTPSPSGFSAEWLSLREPADARARSARATLALADALPTDRPVRVLDLGAGTGSNARYLSSFLPGDVRWLLVDQDPHLLDLALAHGSPSTDVRVADLARLEDHRDLFSGRDVVTASALLDLVSETWLAELLERCRGAGACVLFALSYDGRIACTPVDREDDRIRDLVNRHQRIDKGFGPALGPDAARESVRRLEALGYQVVSDTSDWTLGSGDEALQRQLIDGWAEAAAAMAPEDADAIEGWRARRHAYVRGGGSVILVGHQDVAGLLRQKATRSRE